MLRQVAQRDGTRTHRFVRSCNVIQACGHGTRAQLAAAAWAPPCDAADVEGVRQERRAGTTPPNFLGEKSQRLQASTSPALHYSQQILPVLIINAALTHPVTGCSFVRLSKFSLLSPRPESGFTDSLQIVGSEGQLGRRRRHGPEETRQQCIENSRKHVDEAHHFLIHLYITAATGPGRAACMVVCVSLCGTFPCTFYRQPSGGSHTTHG